MNRLLHSTTCILVLVLLSTTLLTGCTTPTPQRGHSPWVFRTSLNEQPRMLVAALSDSLWVSYQTPFCGLSAVWRDGVSFDGPVYTTIQGKQPSSIGRMYIKNPPDSPWEIREGASAVFYKAVYTGHRIRDGKLELNYLFLTASGKSIRVKEIPEFVRNSEGNPGLQREFWVENLPENHTIVLRTMINSVPGRNYIQTNGEIQLTGPPAQPDSARLGLELLAIIRLKAHSPTRLTTWFIPNPVIPNPFDPTGKEPDPNSGFGLVEKSGCKTCHDENQNLTGPSFTAIAKKYKTGVLTNQTLAAKVLGGGTGVWGENVMIAHPHLKQIEAIKMVEWILSLDPDDQYGEWFSLPPADTTVKHPGDGEKLPGVHPSYDLSQARPEGFHPRVGGLDFLPDGRMVVCTWDGYVYLLGNLQQPDPEKIEVKTIAEGLAEPLGLKVVDGKIYVLQKQELTLLIDHNGDDVADEYANICNSWPVSANYHEFAFGLEYKDGFFYATLSSPLGKAEPHYPERGSAIKINGETGSYEVIANGFRTPNGLGMSPEGTLFVSDNQGNWLPANKIVEVRKGAFYGYRSRDPELMKDWEETAPMLWLQQADIANSPSQMIFSQDGPYTGQILVGDVTHGGVKRVFTEKVNGVSQGVTFRFTQGLESGVNRLRYGPDGAIYTGGVGAAGNWGQEGKDRYGLQRLRYNGKTTFEMLAVRAKADGMEIEFTEPLPEGSILSPEDFGIKQWRYVPTPAYGGPKTDEKTLEVSRIAISPERNKVRLYLGEMEKGHVIYLHLSPRIKSQSGQQLWSTEAWYTLNEIPGGDQLP